VFFLLGCIGITLIWLAGGNAIEFSENRDVITAALFAPPAGKSPSMREAAGSSHALTNLTAAPAAVQAAGHPS
jgi:hypothetical protein